MDKDCVKGKSWKEFRSTGLLLIINQLLHIFGWAIVMQTNDEGDVVNCFPARVKFRGFSNEDTSEAYLNISDYMEANASILKQEAQED